MALIAALLVAWLPAACSLARPRIVTLTELETAPPIRAESLGHAVLTDPQALGTLYHPLTARLGYAQVRSPAEWARLARAAPGLRPPGDLDTGIVIALVSRAGLPLDGKWPIQVDAARVSHGAGLLTGEFRGGTFLPDGTTCLDVAYFPGLAGVLVVDITGARFFTD